MIKLYKSGQARLDDELSLERILTLVRYIEGTMKKDLTKDQVNKTDLGVINLDSEDSDSFLPDDISRAEYFDENNLQKE